ncbi:MAG TPA: O-antigen ligase family protein [Thermoanaerobaculia bacterium]
MAGLIPPLLLALFGAWCGTFAWGPWWQASAAGTLALLGSLLWIAPPWRDPLRLGPTGRLLPWALWIALAASAWASPVPRAGWVALILLPAFLVLPGVVERCWRRELDRRWGLRGVALAVAGVSLWALIDWLALGSPRAAMPLGHHNLLAAWLVILLPLAVLPAREPGAWRLLGIAAGGLAAGTILASRSLAGCAALGVAALLAFGFRAGRSRRRWGWLALLAAALLISLVQLPRARQIASGTDPSAQARGAYLAAGVQGLKGRPLLGWGPGAVPWTVSAFLDPVLRVNPWGETVGDLHSLPVQLAYELGLTGLLLVGGLAVLFFVRRIAEREEGRDPALLLGGLLGLGGGAVAALGSGAVAVTALPLAAAVAAGAALAGSGRGKGRSSRLPVRIYTLVAVIALFPLELARWHYDRARLADSAGKPLEAEREIAAAARLDPQFPLYPMRLALLRARRPQESAAAAALAHRAAALGGATPSLWLVAGILGYGAKEPWAGAALEKACFLDPFNPFPPFYGLLADRASPEAPSRGAQALLNEPRLAAAVFWERHPDRLADAVALVRGWPEVGSGWKEALLAAMPSSAARVGPTGSLALTIDHQQEVTLALPVFRRRPWDTIWPLIEYRQRIWAGIRIPPAAAAPGTSRRFIHAAPCRRSLSGHDLLMP